MGAALKFKQAQLPRQDAELARVKVIRGPDTGAIFIIQSERVTIGRGEENDIVLSDFRCSRRHAELAYAGGAWSLKDIGSSNGIIYNGKPMQSTAVKTKDTFGLGESLFEFMTSEAPTTMLKAPAASEDQVKLEQAGFDLQRAKVIAMSSFGGLAKNKPLSALGSPALVAPVRVAASAPAPAQQQTDPKKLLTILVALGLAYFLIASPDAPLKKKFKKKEQEQLQPPDLGDLTPQIEKAADVFFRSGFREYRLGNYLRARTQFETVLQVDPTHSLAKLYLESANLKIKSEVDNNLEMGRKSLDSGKLKLARGHFEYVMRLLYRDQNNPAYNEAKEQLATTLKEMEEVK